MICDTFYAISCIRYCDCSADYIPHNVCLGVASAIQQKLTRVDRMETDG